MQKKYLTKEQALQKLKQYCAYQERSSREVVQKLWELGIRKADHDEIVSTLIEEDYLNEERFAKAFAGGKFRMLDWGRKKILYGLKEKGVSDYNIKKGMLEINEDDYQKALLEAAGKKYDSLKGEQFMARKKKTIDYLMQKGYESELITGVMKQLISKE